ncbi:porin family protein [Rufibacter hautae]|uniref:PorT family protein n=1 Tax=Rufibacter hautae TaxID=2595005 RepID=A0A5B6TEC8_9BACT|nr:outer membrane beta-barrel protein [Rufibacter hautae]KAA3438817.1 PorT family protein [Rufibacter hautae]
MNLNNMSDEELDRLFKASADNFDPPFDPEAWAAMDQKLEQVQVRHRWFRRYYPFVSLFLLITIVTIYQLVDRSAMSNEPDFLKTKQNQELAETSISELKEGKSKVEGKQWEAKEITGLNNTKPGLETGSTRDARRDNTTAFKETGKREPSKIDITRQQEKQGNLRWKNAVAIGLRKRDNQKEQRSTKETSSTDDSRISASASRKFVDLALVEKQIISAVEGEKSVEVESANEKPTLDSLNYRSLVLAPAIKPAEITMELLSLDSSFTSQNLKNQLHEAGLPKRTSAFMSYVQIGLAVAPDFTMVKFKNPDAVSANAGVLLGVPLTEKLSLVSGVVWANKVYSANAEDYYFSNGYTYTEPVDATCKVIDIPLNLQYKVFGNEKNAFAIQAGLSSYLMLSEEYSSGGYYPYYNEVSNENQHWFKVQNVSLVYNRILSPAFSFGVEPFVKIPYGGIGDGKVKLTSAGVFFSAGYRIKLKP